MADCEVCNETMADVPPECEPTDICASCCHDMLSYASEFQIDAFLDIEVESTGRARIVVGEDVGPGIEYQNYGPFSLGDAFRRAKKYNETGDEQWLKPEQPEPCPMCDDTGYELSQEPGAFCTLCARGLAVATQPESEGT